MQIRHAILEVITANSQLLSQSAIILNDEFIISSASILTSYVSLGKGDFLGIQRDGSANCELINKLKQLCYQVTFDCSSLKPLALKSTERKLPLSCYPAKLLNIFCIKEVLHLIRKMRAENIDDLNQSSFMVLLLMRSNVPETYFESFLCKLNCYSPQSIRVLDDIIVICTPFGMHSFHKTVSIGKISNVVNNGHIFGISNALPLGCEGSAVFNANLKLIGIIFCTSFQRRGENVNMSLAISFDYLIEEFTQKRDKTMHIRRNLRKVPIADWHRSLVLITSKRLQGSGTFVKIQNKKYILTCAHVVGITGSIVTCRSHDGEFETSVLWANPKSDCPYDIALLTAPPKVPSRNFISLSQIIPTLGQIVYNAGFPNYLNSNTLEDFNAAILEGRIIRYDRGAIMSDGCLQSGQSGGPMLDESGNLIGICVSNMKVDQEVFPHLSTAVPINDIKTTLCEYAKTNDIKVLNKLIADQTVQDVWALKMPPIQSKL